MADAQIEVLIELNNKVSSVLKKLKKEGEDAFGGIKPKVDNVNKGMNEFKKTTGGVLRNLGIMAGAIGAGMGVQSILDAGVAMEKYNSMLKVQLGSVENAKIAMDGLLAMADKMPSSLEEVTRTFIKLKGAGIAPTSSEMFALADLAASQGKNILDLAEATTDATMGEFERLKEFNIKAKNNGKTITMTFNGVTKTVNNNKKAIKDLLMEFGKMKGISGSATDQMKTFGGAISNLKDFLFKLSNEVFTKFRPQLVSIVDGIKSMAIGFVQVLFVIWKLRKPLIALALAFMLFKGVGAVADAVKTFKLALDSLKTTVKTLTVFMTGLSLSTLAWTAAILAAVVLLSSINWERIFGMKSQKKYIEGQEKILDNFAKQAKVEWDDDMKIEDINLWNISKEDREKAKEAFKNYLAGKKKMGGVFINPMENIKKLLSGFKLELPGLNADDAIKKYDEMIKKLGDVAGEDHNFSMNAGETANIQSGLAKTLIINVNKEMVAEGGIVISVNQDSQIPSTLEQELKNIFTKMLVGTAAYSK